MNDNINQKLRCNGMPSVKHAPEALHYTALATEAKAWREKVDIEVA